MLTYLFTHTPLYFFTQSFWRDEAFTVIMAQQPIINLLITTAKDFNPPLYYLVVHFWMKLFGSSEISIRTISLIFYWLTIYVGFLFLNNVFKFNLKKSFVYLILIIVNPLLISYACEARMYTMLAFFASISLYFFLRKEKKWYILSTTLGLYTHYFMIFVLIIQFLMLVVSKNRKMLWKQNNFIAIPILLSIPWDIFVLLQKNIFVGSFWILKTSVNTIFNMPTFLFTGYDLSNNYYNQSLGKTSLFLWLIIMVGSFIFWKKYKQHKNIYFIFLLWGIIVPLCLVLLSLVKPIFLPRYLIFTTVGLLLLIIIFIDRLPVFLKTIILGILILISINYTQLEIKNHKKSDYRSIMTKIKYLAKPNDVMYVTNELDYFTASYYFHKDRVYVYGKTYEEIPDYVGKVLIPKSRFVYWLPLYPNHAFILTSDSHYDIQTSFSNK